MEKVIAIIKENLLDIIPELADEEFSNDDSFVDLGANSLDRGELITLTLEHINLDIPRIELAKAQTINELAELISLKKMNN
ncbi:acyl carrier protein [Aquimarina sp. RZ0]|uniref:acyl carrier protein n=1 Tax=Aquimarina sp. RZ0 TaxID=2607730 RepID=UPI0011F0F11C|nr:acyl carrier protein [Aquimarina sp. RZ0]KAA1242937.1 acyl carrier protein [Aquimarina sp. RZ0]